MSLNPWLVYIRAVTDHYKGYKLDTHLPDTIRGFEMARARRDWEMCAAIYKIEQRREWIKRVIQGWKFP